MSTVVRRTFVSTPARSAAATWEAIVDLLTKGKAGSAKDTLLAVKGVASNVIAEEWAKDAAIVVTGEGPRTRIYCLYGEDAVDGSDANEAALSHDPLGGDWAVSLPCDAEDLDWVQASLKRHGSRVTARDKSSTIAVGDGAKSAAELTINLEGLFKP